MQNELEIVVARPRPLPVVLLADVSGSMDQAGKIGSLNSGVRELIAALGEADGLFAEPHLATITFGGTQARVHQELAPIAQVRWTDMKADGATPMGHAFELARVLLEDRAVVPSRAYRPVLVLVSDGIPNDAWEQSLDQLLKSERGGKADRFALAVGPDADRQMLARFTGDRERVLHAQEAKGILRFFQFVTMSVMARSRAAQPNQMLPPPALRWEE